MEIDLFSSIDNAVWWERNQNYLYKKNYLHKNLYKKIYKKLSHNLFFNWIFFRDT